MTNLPFASFLKPRGIALGRSWSADYWQLPRERNDRPPTAGYEPCSGHSEKRRILANILHLNNVQHVQFVPHVQHLETIYDLRLGTQGKRHDRERSRRRYENDDPNPLPHSRNRGVFRWGTAVLAFHFPAYSSKRPGEAPNSSGSSP